MVASKVTAGNRIVQRPRQPQAVCGSIEKIGVTKANVGCALLDLLPDVGQHHVGRNDAECALVHRHHRAVPAQMLAAAATLGKSDRLVCTIRHDQAGIFLKGRQLAAVRDDEFCLAEVDQWYALACRLTRLQMPDHLHQAGFVFSTDDGLHTERAEQLDIHRCVKPVNAQVRAWRELPDLRQRLDGDTCRGVHGNIDGHDFGCRAQAIVESLYRQVAAVDAATFPRQPGRRFSQAERLAAQLVGIDQRNSHL